MSVEYGEVNKYNQVSQFPSVDLVFTGPKRSLVDRVSGNTLQFTRNTIGTYVDSNGIIQTAAAGEPRYTYDPLTGKELGLLVEESRTNLLTYSEQFDQWTVGTNSTVTPNAATAPDGTLTASTYSSNGAQLQSSFIPITSNTNYTSSIYIKKTTGRTYTAGLTLNYDGGVQYGILLNTNDGTTSSASYTLPTVAVSSAGNFWRISLTANSGSAVNVRVYVYPNMNSNTAIATGQQVIWGAQLEEGSFTTSYIPTSGSTVTRDPDTITFTNNNIYNNSQFDIINDPFGMSAGSDTLTLLPSASNSSAIKRATIFSSNIAQNKINAFAETDEFWRWRVTGDSFGLPTNVQSDGDMTIDWGDGVVEQYSSSFLAGPNAISHTFVDSKTYHEIGFRLDSGTYFKPRLYQDGTNRTKLVSIGPAPENMRVDLDSAFRECLNLEVIDPTFVAGGTGTSNSLYSSFRGVSKLKSFPKIDTSSITNFSQSWFSCSNLTSFPIIDTSSGTNFTEAWNNCNSLTSFPLIDTSSGTNFTDAWRGCSSLTSFPLIDTSSGINFTSAWRDCTSFTSFPLIDTSSGTNFTRAWRDCTTFTSFPLIDTSSGTAFNAAWQGCTSLTSFPLIDTSSGITFNSAWNSCTSLTSFPLIDTSSGTNFRNTWRSCTSLTSFPANFFDSWTGTPASNCFVDTWDGCTSLTATSVENILNSIYTSGQSAPASFVDITIDYDVSSGTPDVTVSGVDLIRKGWTTTLNGVAKTDPYSFASLDLDFATNLTLNDNISNSNLITFTRSSTGTYVDSNGIIQTASIDTPRFDHDPETGESLGLLIEESRTNLFTYGTTLGTDWTVSQGTLTTSAAISPDGTLNATKLTPNATLSQGHYTQQTETTTASSSFSVYAKADGYNYVWLWTNVGNAVFDLSNGTVSSTNTVTANVTPVSNGWYRLSISGIAATTSQFRIYSFPTSSTSAYSGDGTSGVFLWAAQLEAGDFPTSYIPTSGSTVTRAADIAEITGTNLSSFYNQSEWTVYSEEKLKGGSGFTWTLNASNNNKRYGMSNLTDFFERTSDVGGGRGTILINASADLSGVIKKACAMGSSANMYTNGLQGTTTDAFENYPLAATEFAIGYRGSYLPDSFMNGHISRLTYWPKRLTDTSLQYLTQ